MKALKSLCLFLLICSFTSCFFNTKFTGIRFETDNAYIDAGEEAIVTICYVEEDVVNYSKKIDIAIYNGETQISSATITSGDRLHVKMPTTEGEMRIIVATAGTTTSRFALATKNSSISVTDRPIGFASVGAKEKFGGLAKGESYTVVKTRDELISAVGNGGIIYIEGMIDMSDGMLPSTGGGSTTKLDEFVASKTSYANYADWKKKETAVSASENKQFSLRNDYKNKIQLNLKSDTTLIGLDSNSGIKGVAISISNVENIAIRNLTLQDAYDPFPSHEANDGWNSLHDLIGIQGSSKNIWIDHCTLEDTMKLSTAANGEKWQTYDGLCDMKASCKNITISNCIFRNHDKTMLIGSSDSDGSNETRHITICGNYFQNCGQRLPMVRNAKAHIFNNYYANVSGGFYSTSYCIGNRAGALIVAENNYFSAGSSVSDSAGVVYASGNKGLGNSGDLETTFNPYDYYMYVKNAASTSPKTEAGAGKLDVIQ